MQTMMSGSTPYLFPFSSYMQKTKHVFGSCATVLPKNRTLCAMGSSPSHYTRVDSILCPNSLHCKKPCVMGSSGGHSTREPSILCSHSLHLRTLYYVLWVTLPGTPPEILPLFAPTVHTVYTIGAMGTSGRVTHST